MNEENDPSSGQQHRNEEYWSEPPRPTGPLPLIILLGLLVVIVVVGYLVLKSNGDEGSQEGSDNRVASEGSLQSQPADAAATGASPSVAPSASADASAPSATAVSPADATATTIGGDPSTEGAWRYVVQPDDFPVAVADRFMLKSWRDIYALNGWTTLEEFPTPGTEILLPPSTMGTSGQPCNESTVLQELSASDADFKRLRNLMQSGEIWISSFECGAGRGRGIDSNYAGFDFTSNTPYACFSVGSPDDSYPCGAPGPDDGYDCDRPPGEQALDQEIVCYSPDGESSSAERVNGRWAYLAVVQRVPGVTISEVAKRSRNCVSDRCRPEAQATDD